MKTKEWDIGEGLDSRRFDNPELYSHEDGSR